MKKEILIVLIAVIFLFSILLYPFEVSVTPKWTVSVVDEFESPLEGVTVRLVWQHYSVEEKSHEVDLRTDGEGLASFDRKTIRASLLSRMVGAAWNIVVYLPHGSWGPHAYVFAISSEYSDEDGRNLSDAGSSIPQEMHSILVLRRCPKGVSGEDCRNAN